ncbi:MAG: PH domain-containing protein [Gammaproteobacteria bacterium]
MSATISVSVPARPRRQYGNGRKREVGWGVRVGAGALWGGFGWLWTQRRGIVQMYISRINDLVWIECTSGRPWLISPEQPHLFIQAMAAAPRVRTSIP